MTTYVALLRGINVGGNNKIAMPELQTCFAALGYTNVVTYINSGNVIFTTKQTNPTKLAAIIEQAIDDTFGLTIPVLIRPAKNIAAICKSIPDDWQNNAEQKTDIMFLWDAVADKSTVDGLVTNPKVDTVQYVDGAIIWHLKKKHYNKSAMGDVVGTKLYKQMTVRNVNTVRKLNELLNT